MNHDTSTVALAEALRAEIRRGRPGDRLPSTRQLVDAHRVSPVTVSRALSALAGEGLLVTRPGAGTFIAEPVEAAEPLDYSWQTVALADRVIDAAGMAPLTDLPGEDGLISLGTGYLHASLMPAKLLSAAMARAARLPDAWERPPLSGLDGLRAWFAQQAGVGVDRRDVVITPGGQGAISAVLRALVPAGEPLLIESPTYPGAVAVARAAGIRPVPVPTDEHGVVPDLLAETFARTRAKAFLIQPTFANPTATILDASRREAVLAAAAAAGAFVVEDDYARWLSHGPRPPRPLLADDREGRVVYIASLTKVTSPSLRVGAVIARGPVAQRIRNLRLVDDMFVSRPIQEATLELVSRAAWERHLAALTEALRRRSAAFARGIAEHLPAAALTARPTGGIHLWVRLPARCDDLAVADAARRHGVVVMPGRHFFPAEPPAPYLRLTFSAAGTEAELDTGLQRLAAAVPALAAR